MNDAKADTGVSRGGGLNPIPIGKQPEGAHAFVQFLQAVPDNKDFWFQFLDFFPLPVEVFAPDGTSIFFNRAGLEMNNISDPGLVVGKYNLLNDPVCNDQMGMRENIKKAFDGEPVVCPDVVIPIQDLVDRGVISEKPFEKSFADFYLYPIMRKGVLVFVVFFYVVKKMYYGRPDVAKAREYIDTHWLEKFDSSAVAKHVNMSVNQLYSIFKKHIGMTPGDYYRSCKVEHIKQELANKNISIKEAFIACGADNHGTFGRIFRKWCGMSPNEYRNTLTIAES